MISTALKDGALLHLYHRVTGLVTEEEVRAGLVEAHEVMKGALYDLDPLPLIVDKRDCTFASLDAQRLWSKGLAEDEFIRKNIQRTAVVATDSPGLRMEMANMATDRLQFFLTLEDARNWIRSAN